MNTGVQPSSSLHTCPFARSRPPARQVHGLLSPRAAKHKSSRFLEEGKKLLLTSPLRGCSRETQTHLYSRIGAGALTRASCLLKPGVHHMANAAVASTDPRPYVHTLNQDRTQRRHPPVCGHKSICSPALAALAPGPAMEGTGSPRGSG